VLDELEHRWKKVFGPGKSEYLFLRHAEQEQETVLIKPLTFMNNSGWAVEDALTRFEAGISDLLVVVDDIALPLGKLRFRPAGSDGGHNGLASVIAVLQSDQFARLRCGIGREEHVQGSERADFVLSPFTKDENDRVTEMVTRAADAVEIFLHDGIESAMSRCNT
jgi:PTH1 family peptidyl-tRNA hydrolase